MRLFGGEIIAKAGSSLINMSNNTNINKHKLPFEIGLYFFLNL